MTFKPDYGLRQMQDGFSPDVDQNFYDFRLYNLTVPGRDMNRSSCLALGR